MPANKRSSCNCLHVVLRHLGNLNPCCWTIATQMWLRRSCVAPLEVTESWALNVRIGPWMKVQTPTRERLSLERSGCAALENLQSERMCPRWNLQCPSGSRFDLSSYLCFLFSHRVDSFSSCSHSNENGINPMALLSLIQRTEIPLNLWA